MSLTATIASPIALLPIENPFLKLKKNVWSSPVGLKPLRVQFQPFERRTNVTRTSRVKHSSMICAAALIVECMYNQLGKLHTDPTNLLCNYRTPSSLIENYQHTPQGLMREVCLEDLKLPEQLSNGLKRTSTRTGKSGLAPKEVQRR
ncbi:hypothetical protein BUALT_Bualt17G0051800 [Buddleja alternifolia]|uniref:Uncharacterized protein n=1 Tax=Buddleja alternifolia TaxID=168488 RepID=A0AAV6WBS5_9LAMI|nr:hypothetical protein BUALT_Bualt17G0051800 [Buddleja alternifolia]